MVPLDTTFNWQPLPDERGAAASDVGTHIHHLNYGIFLLSGLGTFSDSANPKWRGERSHVPMVG